jgi:enolase
MAKIKLIKAREILDSKGSPTVEVDLVTDMGLFQASVPSGVSEGKYEALELRDGGKRYGGRGVLKAVKNVNEIIAPKLVGKDPTTQKQIDSLMIELDGTENKSRLGANAILPVSAAVCRAGAQAKKLPLYKYISQLSHQVFPTAVKKTLHLPIPCLLMIEGGMHAGNKLDIQEFMIAPETDFFKERLRMGAEIYQTLRLLLEKNFGEFATNVGLEGGFAPPLSRTGQALDLIMKAIDEAGYKNKVKIVLDIAASHFYKDKTYKFQEGAFTQKGFLNFYSDLIENYPIFAIEDPFDQEDWQAWQVLMSSFKSPAKGGARRRRQNSNLIVVGDDLLATNIKRIKRAIKENACNGLVLKPEQTGTITETLEAGKLAQKARWRVFVKHRGGEVNDDFIADLAVGLGAEYIMAGAPCRGERVAKYNRLLRIEENLKS